MVSVSCLKCCLNCFGAVGGLGKELPAFTWSSLPKSYSQSGKAYLAQLERRGLFCIGLAWCLIQVLFYVIRTAVYYLISCSTRSYRLIIRLLEGLASRIHPRVSSNPAIPNQQVLLRLCQACGVSDEGSHRAVVMTGHSLLASNRL